MVKNSSADFQQRFFVQYLWTGSKEKDKAKVAEDFSASNQLLSVQQQKHYIKNGLFMLRFICQSYIHMEQPFILLG
uniref:Uncharacterized protein n=1 Tax=Romanomermis culicivorax TaxID=13658 RepID=A0A915JKS9_ROMCU